MGEPLHWNMREYQSVQLWIDAVNSMFHLSVAEWDHRLEVLHRFCESEGKDPDTIISEARSDRAEKLDYMRHLKRFVKSLSPSATAVHDYENIVRSFFINNGARVVTKPYADVYQRTTD